MTAVNQDTSGLALCPHCGSKPRARNLDPRPDGPILVWCDDCDDDDEIGLAVSGNDLPMAAHYWNKQAAGWFWRIGEDITCPDCGDGVEVPNPRPSRHIFDSVKVGHRITCDCGTVLECARQITDRDYIDGRITDVSSWRWRVAA